MIVEGYGIGEIRAEAAMTSDIVMHPGMTFDRLNLAVEVERRTMDVRPGMNRKYTPLLHDAVTGGLLSGGRYVFDTWENVRDYRRWTHEELKFEPGVKFWERPIFPQVGSHLWKVVGAHDFTPVDTHGVNRLERWRYTAGPADAQALLVAAWPGVRDRARAAGLGTV